MASCAPSSGKPRSARASFAVSRSARSASSTSASTELIRIGYPSIPARMQAPDWRSAFTLMVEGILQDAADAGAPVPADRVRDVLSAHGSALDACTTASVVHGDLWAGNLFLDSAQRIVGLIDTERTLWGDPLFDLIGADQFGLWNVDPDLLEGNTEHGGILAAELASPTGPTRFALYRLYFSVILVTEISVRDYEGEWVAEHRKSAEGMLAAVLQRFDELAPTNTTTSALGVRESNPQG
ncbi:phosphotransferase [Microbacterium azadirachtae]